MTINDVILTAVANLQRQFPALSFEYLYGQILIAVLFGIAKTSTNALGPTLGFIESLTERGDSTMLRFLGFLATEEARIAFEANAQYLNELTHVLVPAFANEESVAILTAFSEAARDTDYEPVASGLVAAVRLVSDRAAEGLNPVATLEEIRQAAPLYLTD